MSKILCNQYMKPKELIKLLEQCSDDACVTIDIKVGDYYYMADIESVTIGNGLTYCLIHAEDTELKIGEKNEST